MNAHGLQSGTENKVERLLPDTSSLLPGSGLQEGRGARVHAENEVKGLGGGPLNATNIACPLA